MKLTALIPKKGDNFYPSGNKAEMDSQFDYKSENEVWTELKKGNEQAFNYIYKKYVNSLFNFGMQFTSSKDILKDCIQNVYIDIRKGKNSVKEMYSIKSYLFKCLKREVIRKLEKESRHVDFKEENTFLIDTTYEERIIDDEINEEQKRQFKKALEQLTVKQRQIIILYYKEGFTYEEVSGIMGLKNSKSARKLLYRAISSARSFISNQ